MKKIRLFDRSEEIYNALPKEYAEIILNSIIARSVQSGDLFSEVEIFLSSEQFDEFKAKFQKRKNEAVKAKDVEKREPERKLVQKKKSREEKIIEEASNTFII